MRTLLILLFISFNTFAQEDIERYKLYPTENINIHLKLDTKKGNVYMVQRTNNAPSQEILINVLPIIMLYSNEYVRKWTDGEIEHKEVIGRYELYPTENIWTFLM